MDNWVAVAATVSNFIGIILMIAYGLPRLREERPLEDFLFGLIGLVLFTLGTAVRIVTLYIPLS